MSEIKLLFFLFFIKAHARSRIGALRGRSRIGALEIRCTGRHIALTLDYMVK